MKRQEEGGWATSEKMLPNKTSFTLNGSKDSVEKYFFLIRKMRNKNDGKWLIPWAIYIYKKYIDEEVHHAEDIV